MLAGVRRERRVRVGLGQRASVPNIKGVFRDQKCQQLVGLHAVFFGRCVKRRLVTSEAREPLWVDDL